MEEKYFKKGVISKGKLRRKLRRYLRPKLIETAGAIPFVWQPLVLPTIKIKNQYSSSSCGGQAASYWLEIVDRKLANQDIPFSAKSIYAPIAYPQGGTTVYALEQQIGKLGANFESDVPSYQFANFTNEAWMTNKAYLTPDIAQKALRDAHRTSVSVPINIDAMAQAIDQSGAIIIEIEGKDGEIPSWLSSTPTPPNPNNPHPIWRHFICGVSYGTIGDVKTIAFVNSWGENIGMAGFQYLRENYINSGHVIDAFTWYPISVTTQNTVNTSTWIWRIYQWMLHFFLT